MRLGLKDINGSPLYSGDTLQLPYIDPMGGVHYDEDGEQCEIVFKHGCYGVGDGFEFVPLMSLLRKTPGEYVPNRGVKTIYSDIVEAKIVEK